ncbi:hypothetical protein [Clostridium sp.]|uniref:hypothetical protein n=1 Tax=Clostridium sp. TaxID=1506 RepID=UPI002FCC68BE
MRRMIHEITEYCRTISLATKALIFIGIISLVETVIAIFLDVDQTSPNDVAIRSVMSNIFGFVFGAQLSENSNVKNRHLQTLVAVIVASICLSTLILGHWIDVNQTGASSVEIRNLLFSAVGFLLSRAKSIE